MTIYIGSNAINEVYLGSTALSEVYLGDAPIKGGGPFSPEQMPGYSFYTSGSRADVSSGAVGSLNVLGDRPAMTPANVTITSGVLDFNGTSSQVPAPAITADTRTLSLSRAIDLPLGQGAGVNGGFTCTGCDFLPDGLIAVSNSGSDIESSGNPHNPAIVILQVDFAAGTCTKISETALVPMGVPVSSIQGLAYVSQHNRIAVMSAADDRIYMINATTMEYEGSWNGGQVIAGGNGLGYDEDTDCLITSVPADAVAIWRDFTTGTVVRTVPFSNNSNKDHILYSKARKSLFVTIGGNGEDGRVAEYRASELSGNGPIINYTLTGADAIEGVLVTDNHIVVMNDRGFHAGGAAIPKNRILIYDLPAPLPKSYPWPVGKTVQFFGVISIPVAATSTVRVIASVGSGFSNGRGVSLVQPITTTTGLQITSNGVSYVFTGLPSLTTSRLIYATVDLEAMVAEIWVDGVSYGTVSGASATGEIVDQAPPMLGNLPSSTRWYRGKIVSIGAAVDELANRQKIEGFVAWDTGNVALLPADHPYKDAAPLAA